MRDSDCAARQEHALASASNGKLSSSSSNNKNNQLLCKDQFWFPHHQTILLKFISDEFQCFKNVNVLLTFKNQGSSVGIATGYGLEFESRYVEEF
jgi:hypothetical protein